MMFLKCPNCGESISLSVLFLKSFSCGSCKKKVSVKIWVGLSAALSSFLIFSFYLRRDDINIIFIIAFIIVILFLTVLVSRSNLIIKE